MIVQYINFSNKISIFKFQRAKKIFFGKTARQKCLYFRLVQGQTIKKERIGGGDIYHQAERNPESDQVKKNILQIFEQTVLKTIVYDLAIELSLLLGIDDHLSVTQCLPCVRDLIITGFRYIYRCWLVNYRDNTGLIEIKK